MDEDDLKFSWTGMFLVSGCCSILFSFITKFLEGGHSELLLKIGAISLGMGFISLTVKKTFKKSGTRKRKRKLLS